MYYRKLKRGIITSYVDYDQHKNHLWIHHWLVLQFLSPLFVPKCPVAILHQNNVFAHTNYHKCIRDVDCDVYARCEEFHHAELPKHKIEWKGKMVVLTDDDIDDE